MQGGGNLSEGFDTLCGSFDTSDEFSGLSLAGVQDLLQLHQGGLKISEGFMLR